MYCIKCYIKKTDLIFHHRILNMHNINKIIPYWSWCVQHCGKLSLDSHQCPNAKLTKIQIHLLEILICSLRQFGRHWPCERFCCCGETFIYRIRRKLNSQYFILTKRPPYKPAVNLVSEIKNSLFKKINLIKWCVHEVESHDLHLRCVIYVMCSCVSTCVC